MTSLIQKATNWGKSVLGSAPEKTGVPPESGMHAIHFVCHDDGTTIDTNTGLTWMRCAFGQVWDGRHCTGAAKSLTWDQAMALNHSCAGHNDWRVPTIDELQSLTTSARSYRNTYSSIFPNAPNATYWSSSPSTKDPSLIQLVQLPSGSIETCAKDYGFGKRLRLVRGGKSTSVTDVMSPELSNSFDIALRVANSARRIPSASSEAIFSNHKSQAPKFVYEQGADPMVSGTTKHLDMEKANEVDVLQRFKTILDRLNDRFDRLENRLEKSIDRIEEVLSVILAGQSVGLDEIAKLQHHTTKNTEVFTAESGELRQLIDRMESFGAFSERIEKAIKLSDLTNQDHTQPPALSIEQFEKAIKSLFSGQLAAMQHIVKKVDLRSDENISLTNTLLIELQRLSAYDLLSHHARDEPVNGTVPNTPTTGVVSTTTLLTQLVDLKTISLAELRVLLLPLDLLPSAVINDINERALNLTGELALIEEGDMVIVQREVLSQVVADWPLSPA